MATTLEVRQALVDHNFTPIPLTGKRPPFDKWEKVANVSRPMLEAWEHNFPRATNTGILTRLTPTIDIDVLNALAASAAEDLVRERFEERGYLLVRIGRAPKRAIPFRTDTPFKKLTTNFQVTPGADAEKLEFLADGQQVVAFGIHPDTQKPYGWFGGDLTTVAYDDLPFISAEEARTLQDDLANLLVRDFGYVIVPGRARAKGNGTPGDHASDWQALIDGIRAGNDLHNKTRDLAAKMVRSGMAGGAVVNFLRGLMDSSSAPRDQRFEDRYDNLPRQVDSIQAKIEAEQAAAAAAVAPAAPGPTPAIALPAQPPGPPPAAPGAGSGSGGPPPPPPGAPAIAPAPAAAPAPGSGPSSSTAIAATIAVFDKWLILKDHTPIYAALGTVAANLLPGDPVWLGVIAPPSSAKTDIMNALRKLPNTVQAATFTPAALLSGTPKRQRATGAKGGLLRQVGNFGILILKDFGSILNMRPDVKAEALAALREIYDGAWTRHLGTDGGRTESWSGKLGLVFGATYTIDSHYSVIGAMGDRFLLSRFKPVGKGQLECALRHAGSKTVQMRKELEEAVAELFAGSRPDPRPISEREIRWLSAIVALVVRLRGAIERDRQSREIEAVLGAEGPARIGLCLERLLAGLDTIGVPRPLARRVVRAVAMDSVPPLRRNAYEYLVNVKPPMPAMLFAPKPPRPKTPTTKIAAALDLPTTTVRRGLEDLAAYRLVKRESQGKGKADLWWAVDE